MKKFAFILNIIISMLIFASCKDENSFMSVDDEPCYSILVSAPDNSTRATYMEDGEDIAVVWEKGDVIYVGTNQFVYKEDRENNTALFVLYGELQGTDRTVKFGEDENGTQIQSKNNKCHEVLVGDATGYNFTNPTTAISLQPKSGKSLLHIQAKSPAMFMGKSLLTVNGLATEDYTIQLGTDPSLVFADKNEQLDIYVTVPVGSISSGKTLKFYFYAYENGYDIKDGDEYHYYMKCNASIAMDNDKVVKMPLPNKPTHVAIQMGLSVKWAPVNIGATDRAETGTYFAWGEIEPAPGGDYSEGNCKAYNKKWDALYKNGYVDKGNANGILVPKYDAATQNWGDDWKMPTRAEFQELMDNCSYEMVKPGDYYGYEFTSKIITKRFSLLTEVNGKEKLTKPLLRHGKTIVENM